MIAYLSEVESKVNSQSHITLEQFKGEVDINSSGFYWIYTNLNIDDFIRSAKPAEPKLTNISQLSLIHKDLTHVIKKNEEKYWCIYNGKGKCLKNRVTAQFTHTSSGSTGSLALSRCFNEASFRVKYVECDKPNHAKGILPVYACLEKDLERAWRLNNGWPLLCRA